jgi:hypothetical protein
MSDRVRKPRGTDGDDVAGRSSVLSSFWKDRKGSIYISIKGESKKGTHLSSDQQDRIRIFTSQLRVSSPWKRREEKSVPSVPPQCERKATHVS